MIQPRRPIRIRQGTGFGQAATEEREFLLHGFVHPRIALNGDFKFQQPCDDVVLLGHAGEPHHAVEQRVFFRRHAEGNGFASPAVAAVHHFSRHDTSPFRSFSNLSAISLCLDGKRCA